MLCGVEFVYANTPTSSSEYSLQAFKVLSAKSTKSFLFKDESLKTDIGHLTIPAFILGYSSKVTSFSISDLAIGNS